MGVAECIWAARGVHRYHPVGPHEQVWCCVPSYDAFERIQQPIFEQMLPQEWLAEGADGRPGRFNKSDKYVRVQWDPQHGEGHCKLWFLTYEQDPRLWVGAAVGFAWCDEPPPRRHVHELFARLRSTRGSLLMTFTPVDGIGWWYDSIWLPAKQGKIDWFHHQAALAERDELNPAEHEVGRVLVPHFRAPYQGVDQDGNRCTCASKAEHGTCRACRQQVIEMAQDYPDLNDRLIRVFGEVVGKEGLVYKQYDENIHLIDRFEITPDFELMAGVDPGYHGFHVTFLAISPENRVYVVEEVFSKGETTQIRYEKIARKIESLRPNPEDWRSYARAEVPVVVDTEDRQVVDELNIEATEYLDRQSRYGMGGLMVELAFAPLEQGLKARKAGFLKIQQMLMPDPQQPKPSVVEREPHPAGEPEIYFFNDLHCEWKGSDRFHTESRLLWEIKNYTWKEPVRNTTVMRDDADENSAQGAHAMASFRYAIMSRFANESPHRKRRRDFRRAVAAQGDLTPDDRRTLDNLHKQLDRLDRRREREDEIGW